MMNWDLNTTTMFDSFRRDVAADGTSIVAFLPQNFRIMLVPRARHCTIMEKRAEFY